MSASELVENAIKYGEAVPGMPEASFCLTVDSREITITVANGVLSSESLRVLRERIDALNATADKLALYLERLQELMESPARGGRLGLLRVAFEGQFVLSYAYVAPTLTIIARRGIP